MFRINQIDIHKAIPIILETLRSIPEFVGWLICVNMDIKKQEFGFDFYTPINSNRQNKREQAFTIQLLPEFKKEGKIDSLEYNLAYNFLKSAFEWLVYAWERFCVGRYFGDMEDLKKVKELLEKNI